MNRLDAEAVQSAIRSIFDKRHGWNGLVHCQSMWSLSTTLFIWTFSNVSPRSVPSICPKGNRSTPHICFSPFQDSEWGGFLLYSKKLTQSPSQRMEHFSPFFLVQSNVLTAFFELKFCQVLRKQP